MNKDIYRQVAALHSMNIDQGFLATLGTPFLALMYEAIDEATDSVLLVEEKEGRVAGFVAGGIGMGPIYRRMFGSPVRLIWSLLPVIGKPSAVARILEILRYGRGSSTSGTFPEAELLSIAVAPTARGSGVAESLYRRLVEHLQMHGVHAFRITVGNGLAPAHRFYTRMGAVPVGQVEVHAGERSTIYVHHLDAAADRVVSLVDGGLPAVLRFHA